MTTNSPGWMSGRSEPAANDPTMAPTPTSFMAQTLAR